LFEAGARLVVFDIVFAEPTNPDEDLGFAATMQKTNNVVLAKTLELMESPQFRRQIIVTPMPIWPQLLRVLAWPW